MVEPDSHLQGWVGTGRALLPSYSISQGSCRPVQVPGEGNTLGLIGKNAKEYVVIFISLHRINQMSKVVLGS